jgi:hypothetical protein
MSRAKCQRECRPLPDPTPAASSPGIWRCQLRRKRAEHRLLRQRRDMFRDHVHDAIADTPDLVGGPLPARPERARFRSCACCFLSLIHGRRPPGRVIEARVSCEFWEPIRVRSNRFGWTQPWPAAPNDELLRPVAGDVHGQVVHARNIAGICETVHAIAVVINAVAGIQSMRLAIESKQQNALFHGDVFSRAAGMREKHAGVHARAERCPHQFEFNSR